jgi:hypothetical protein
MYLILVNEKRHCSFDLIYTRAGVRTTNTRLIFIKGEISNH